MKRAWTAHLLLAAAAPALGGQSADSEPVSLGTTAAAVAVDVVVRDDKGRVIRDLTAADFEVYEDGELQELEHFQVMAREAAEEEAGGETPDAAASRALRRRSLLALVFDRLSPDGRNLARKAAHAYVEQSEPGLDLIGVFGVGLSLETEQSYTDDAEVLRAAIERAIGNATARHDVDLQRARDPNRERQELRELAAILRDPEAAATAGAEGRQDLIMAATFADMQLRMLRTTEALERDQQGFATLDGLLAVVNSMRTLPGRKSVIFFSEGLSLPPDVMPRFDAIVDAATRGSVTLYAMDAGGLRAESSRAQARREMLAAAEEHVRQRSASTDDFRGSFTREMERNQDRLRKDPQGGLADLAAKTGGFLVRETNDLAGAAQRIGEEVRFYYLLSYTPEDGVYDGRFRNIEVEVKRSGARVQARSGYFAVPADDPFPVKAFEAPALALLAADPRPEAFPVHALALSMPDPERPGLVPVLVEVPGGELTAVADDERDVYRSDLTILARVLDSAGQVVDRTSQHYELARPRSGGEPAAAPDVLFYRELELQPGEYTVEAVAYDEIGRAGAVAGSRVAVRASGDLQLSSLVLVHRAESAGDVGAHPLRFGERILYPNLGEAVHKSEKDQLPVLMKAHAPGGLKAPEATLEIVQGGRSLGQLPLPLPAPGENGRLEHVAGIPLAGFPPGDYELRVTLRDGLRRAVRAATFTVAE